MKLQHNLAALALRQLAHGACRAVGVPAGEAAVQSVVGFLMRHFVDQSQRLNVALQTSSDRAWRALEVALAGDSLWDQCRLVFASGEDKAFRELVRPFLASCPLGELHGREGYLRRCLAELNAARKQGLLGGGALDPSELARRTGAFARFADPQGLLEAEHAALGEIGGELRAAGYLDLAALVSLRPAEGDVLLLVAARYFFRRAVESDAALAQGLTFAQLERLQETQQAGFDALYQVLSEHGSRIEALLGGLQGAVEETRDAVLDVRAEQQRQGEQARDIYQAVLDLQGKLDLLGREVRPQDSLSLRNDQERQLVRRLVARYRALSEDDRGRMPALLNAIGKLEVASGEFAAARADFAAAGALAAVPAARAEAHHNAYRAALEARDWDGALGELREAARLDPARFAPFPLDKYRPQRILGAGGFGVAYLCEHRFLRAPVVVKTLADDEIDRGIDAVFAEAQVLRQLDHPAIIRVQDCGFGSPDGEGRPYLVMDYFEGQTLDQALRERPLSVEELLAVARPVAQGLHAAHGKGILHRDVKPANLLVRRPGGSAGWQARLIDFGLALRRGGRETMLASSRTLVGSSIAGTIDFAAPEQMGRLPGSGVGPPADVYGFARTCCAALFGTPQPLMRHWRSVPADLAELLESCLEEQPSNRPQGFADVLTVLDRLGGVAPPASVPTPPVPAAPLPPATDGDDRRRSLELVAQGVASCTRCPPLARARTQTVFGDGTVGAEICFVGEAPGADEDRTGKPFVGAAGRVLAELLSGLGLARSQVYITNLLKCRTPGNRKPEAVEMRNCREHLLRELDLVKPRSIVCLGASAAQGLLGTAEPIGRLRGRLHDFRGIPVLCTFHPAFLLPGRAPEKRSDVLADLRLLLAHLRKASEAR